MQIVDIFSKRQKRLRGDVPDVYQYDEISRKLRVQVVHIWEDTLGRPYYNDFGDLRYPDGTYQIFEFIHKALCCEYGIFTLDENASTDYDRVEDFFLETDDAEKAIDVIQLSFQCIDPIVYGFDSLKVAPEEAIDELNQRFCEHGVGYQYKSGQIIRVDSQYLHSEIVKPAFTILSDEMYEGANAEFRSAHEHYRAEKYKECLNDCLKALESCIKTICYRRGWHYQESDTVNRLINIIFEHGLIPSSMQSYFSALRNTLEAGVPTLRNKLGGHGQGTREIPVPDYIATYALHLTASNILFLAQSNKNLT